MVAKAKDIFGKLAVFAYVIVFLSGGALLDAWQIGD
jgi:hypothetical protein